MHHSYNGSKPHLGKLLVWGFDLPIEGSTSYNLNLVAIFLKVGVANA